MLTLQPRDIYNTEHSYTNCEKRITCTHRSFTAVFSTKHNVIIGVLYRAPNSCLEFFNKNLEKVLNVIKQEKKDS